MTPQFRLMINVRGLGVCRSPADGIFLAYLPAWLSPHVLYSSQYFTLASKSWETTGTGFMARQTLRSINDSKFLYWFRVLWLSIMHKEPGSRGRHRSLRYSSQKDPISCIYMHTLDTATNKDGFRFIVAIKYKLSAFTSAISTTITTGTTSWEYFEK